MAILWIEDEAHIVGIPEMMDLWPVDTAIACHVAISKLERKTFKIIVMDLIVPITMGDIENLQFTPDYQNTLEENYGGVWLIRYIREKLKLDLPIIVFTIVVGRDRQPVEKLLDDMIPVHIKV